MADVRPLTAGDLGGAAAVMVAALPPPDASTLASRLAWSDRRTSHLLATDPDGCWIAVDGDEVVGAAIALVRDGIWGLSMLAVHPDRHAGGLGGQLMRAALTTLDGARGGLICSSEDPRAMRLYARAGFHLRPCVAAGGIPDRAALPAGLRARPSEDFEAAAALAKPVRGGAYGPDDLAMVAEREGFGMLLVDGEGFAIHHDTGSPTVVCATSEDAATDLLWSCLAAGTRGATVSVDYLSADQGWAVRTCLDAGLPLSPDGPLFTRGELGPLRPWLPSGALL